MTFNNSDNKARAAARARFYETSKSIEWEVYLDGVPTGFPY